MSPKHHIQPFLKHPQIEENLMLLFSIDVLMVSSLQIRAAVQTTYRLNKSAKEEKDDLTSGIIE